MKLQQQNQQHQYMSQGQMQYGMQQGMQQQGMQQGMQQQGRGYNKNNNRNNNQGTHQGGAPVNGNMNFFYKDNIMYNRPMQQDVHVGTQEGTQQNMDDQSNHFDMAEPDEDESIEGPKAPPTCFELGVDLKYELGSVPISL